MKKLNALASALSNLGLSEEADSVDLLIEESYTPIEKESSYNKPRVGKKRWSVKQKRAVNCNNPKGFSQKQYCKRKARGGDYKD